MQTLKYTIIKTEPQYDEYCRILEELIEHEENESLNDEIDLLTLLIEKWDEEHNTFEESDPIELLHYLMTENNLKAKDLADILKVSKGLISDILNYKKSLSKEIIRTLSEYFKVSREAFNRSYELKAAGKSETKMSCNTVRITLAPVVGRETQQRLRKKAHKTLRRKFLRSS